MNRPDTLQKNVLVTGANGGIGSAVGRMFLEREPDAMVWLGVRSGREVADALAAEFPDRCRTVALDVADPASWTAALARISGEGGEINVLVNNAGSHRDTLLATMADEDWTGVVGPNLDGTFYGCRAVLRGMIGMRWGRIINIASLSALLSPAGQANYAAAKAGVLAMGMALSKEVGRMGITVNAICPGYIDTPALDDLSAEGKKAVMKNIPVRRLGRPEEVASAVFFLAGEESGYITGSYLRIDGGVG